MERSNTIQLSLLRSGVREAAMNNAQAAPIVVMLLNPPPPSTFVPAGHVAVMVTTVPVTENGSTLTAGPWT